jgi:ribosomal protein S18 acetylase RimI-like enzyme
MLAVDPHYRGQGLGAVLLRYAEAHAHREQKEELVLEVPTNKGEAVRLYERYGFEKKATESSMLRRWAIGHSQYYRMTKRLK